MRVYMDLNRINNRDARRDELTDKPSEKSASRKICENHEKNIRKIVSEGKKKIDEKKREIEESLNKKHKKRVLKGKIVEVDDKGKIISVVKYLPKGTEKAAIAQFFMEMVMSSQMEMADVGASESVDFSEGDVSHEDIWMMMLDMMNEEDRRKSKLFDEKY